MRMSCVRLGRVHDIMNDVWLSRVPVTMDGVGYLAGPPKLGLIAGYASVS